VVSISLKNGELIYVVLGMLVLMLTLWVARSVPQHQRARRD
jgi:hypothetical protein